MKSQNSVAFTGLQATKQITLINNDIDDKDEVKFKKLGTPRSSQNARFSPQVFKRSLNENKLPVQQINLARVKDLEDKKTIIQDMDESEYESKYSTSK